MNRIKIVGLCLVAMFALSAVATASASAAEPEYQTCAKAAKVGKTYTGKYNNKTCSELNAKDEGKYERVAVKLPDKIKSKGTITLLYLYSVETEKINETVECKKDKSEGELLNGREASLKITYEACEGKGELPGKCTTVGQKEGTILTNPLISTLVWLNAGETEAGIDVAAATKGGALEKVSCAGGVEHAELLGSMVAKVSPVGEASKTETLTYDANPTTGVQEYGGYWEGAESHEDALYAELTGAEEFSDVHTSQVGTYAEKGGEILVG